MGNPNCVPKYIRKVENHKEILPRHPMAGEYKAMNAVMSPALLSVLFIQCIMHKAKGQGPRVKNQGNSRFKNQGRIPCNASDVSGALGWASSVRRMMSMAKTGDAGSQRFRAGGA